MKRIKFIFKVLILTIFSSLFIWFVNADIIFPSSYNYDRKPSRERVRTYVFCEYPFGEKIRRLKWYNFDRVTFSCDEDSLVAKLLNWKNVRILEYIFMLILFFSSIGILISLNKRLVSKRTKLFKLAFLYIVIFDLYLLFLSWWSWRNNIIWVILLNALLITLIYVLIYLIILEKRFKEHKIFLYIYYVSLLYIWVLNIFFLFF